jgi:hypothetical protein
MRRRGGKRRRRRVSPVVVLPAIVSPFFSASPVTTFGAMFLRIPRFATFVQLIDDVASSDKLEAAKEDHLMDDF